MIQGPNRILIADDEPALLKMMGTYLSRLGHAVTVVDTSTRALAQVEGTPGDFAVAVLDASMPGLGMPDLALRILSAHPAMRVLVSSGYPVDMTVLESAAPGRVAFLHKPFPPHLLAELVGRMLAPQEKGL